MGKYTRHFSTTATPQKEAIPGETMVANEAGGFNFPVDDWVRLDRFLILGSEGGTYYTSEATLTKDNAAAVLRCIKNDGVRTVKRIVEISKSGRAPKNDPAIFALAMAAKLGNDETRKLALASVKDVCRIGTYLLQFAESVKAFGGWGQGTMRAFGSWFQQDLGNIAYQSVKYRQREGWALADLLRKAHPKPANAAQNQLFKWIVDRQLPSLEDDRLDVLKGFEEAQKVTAPKAWATLVRQYNLPREALPTEALNSPEVWTALLERMPMTAMIRNLGKMSAVGILTPFSNAAMHVVAELARPERIKEARVHPWHVILALKTYAQGHGQRAQARSNALTWNPVPQVLDALDKAYELAFGNVIPTGKRILLAIDSSGSMESPVMGYSNFTVRAAAATLAHIIMRTEPNVGVLGFTTAMKPLALSGAQRVDDVKHAIDRIATGEGTDAAIPMEWAQETKLTVDAFVLYTDGQTWAGKQHPIQATRNYRRAMNVPAKMVSAAMTETGHSVAPIEDAGCLNIVGFDANAPALITDFLR